MRYRIISPRSRVGKPSETCNESAPFVQTLKTETDPVVVLEVLPAGQNVVVNLLQTLGQPSALLAEGLPQMLDVGLNNLLFHRPYLLGDFTFHILQCLE